MSKYLNYYRIREEDAADFVKAKTDYFDADASLKCSMICEGNLNSVFRITDPASGKSLIVKQTVFGNSDAGAGHKNRSPQAARSKIEYNALKLQSALCPGQVPQVYAYDEGMCAIIMEDMADHTAMKAGLADYETYPRFAEQISSFLAGSLLMTCDIVLDHKEKKRLVKGFLNPESYEISENPVPVNPVPDFSCRDGVFPPIKAFADKEIFEDSRLRDEVTALRHHFMNCPQALIHGDLHMGSILVNQTHTCVVDPEFACFAPMGYDIGNVLANLFFAWANGNASIRNNEKRLGFCGWCMCTIMEIVDDFKEKFRRVYDEHCTDSDAASESFREAYLADVMADAAGYAGTECLRKITGISANGELAALKDEEARAKAERTILLFGKDLILNRKEIQTAGDYYYAMEQAIRTADPQNDLLGTKRGILDYDTVALDDYNHALVIVDQTKLPTRIEMLSLTRQEEIWNAIYLLQVRGAPAIGVAAAIGIYLAARELDTEDYDEFLKGFRKASDYLNSSRPTAVNLSWALKRMEQVVAGHASLPVKDIVKLLHDEALAIREEDINVCRAIGRYGLSLVKPGDGLLTHCNAGQLATVRYGTATAPMYLGHEQGYNFKIYCDETRPLLQGARLTSFELSSAGMDVTVLCDNMSASLMREGKIDAVFVGCDRVAANGDAANKIGTSMAALAAKRYGIPFYVCAPTSTIDRDTPDGSGIVIEQRRPEEVTSMWYEKPMAPDTVKVYNPAFDVTDADLITGIVTEFGVAYPPYEQSIKEIFMKKEIKATVEEIMKDME